MRRDRTTDYNASITPPTTIIPIRTSPFIDDAPREAAPVFAGGDEEDVVLCDPLAEFVPPIVVVGMEVDPVVDPEVVEGVLKLIETEAKDRVAAKLVVNSGSVWQLDVAPGVCGGGVAASP
jgi:ABC-type histidine transport system ATPase subunit